MNLREEIRDIKNLLLALVQKMNLLVESNNEIKEKLEEVSKNIEGIRCVLFSNSKDMISKLEKK